jgi:hypothetical protein
MDDNVARPLATVEENPGDFLLGLTCCQPLRSRQARGEIPERIDAGLCDGDWYGRLGYCDGNLERVF